MMLCSFLKTGLLEIFPHHTPDDIKIEIIRTAIPWKEEEKEEREHRILHSPVIRLISREPICSAAALWS